MNMAKRIAVVVSQGQSANPAKRQLEEDVVAGLLMEPGIDLVVIPHLYDLKPDGTGILALKGIMGNMIVLSWLYERGARWTLDRADIRGKEGLTTIKMADDEEEGDEDEAEEEAEAANGKERVIDTREVPNRKIYCVDLRVITRLSPTSKKSSGSPARTRCSSWACPTGSAVRRRRSSLSATSARRTTRLSARLSK